MSITNKDFRVNRQHLSDALMFLKEKSDDYANIHISLANAATYPEDGILKEVPQRIPDWMLSQGFPDLFPFGKGDTTSGRCRQTFCKPPLICFCGTNMLRRHMTLTLGNVSAKGVRNG